MKSSSTVEAPEVSFVVLCYNLGRYVGECIESILRQEGGHAIEVIVIDDASTDDSAAVLAGIHDPRVHLITHSVNQGHARTVNEGLARASGRFIARMDADDRYRPGFLNRSLAVFQVHPEVDLVYGNIDIIDSQGKVTVARCGTANHVQDFQGREFLPLLERNFICAPSVIARASAWKRVPPVPDYLPFHDWYFTVRMARNGDFYYLDEVIAEYRVHAANLHSVIAADGREETGVLRFLDEIFAEREAEPELEERKQGARARILATHFKDFADKYFWFKRFDEARRCYLRAVRLKPALLFDRGLARRLAGTLIGGAAYERAKNLVRRVQG